MFVRIPCVKPWGGEMIRRSAAILGVACILLLCGTTATAFSAKVTKVRISDRGNGDAYNVMVTTQGQGVASVASVAVEFARGGDAKPEEREHIAQLISKYNRGVADQAFRGATAGSVYTVTATLRSAKGAALGSPQSFEAIVGGDVVEIDAPAERDRNGRVRRIRLQDAGTDATGNPLVRHVVNCEGALVDRVASVELRIQGPGAPAEPVVVPLGRVQLKYRAVVIFEEPAVGARLPLELTMRDEAGKPLGSRQQVEIEVEPARSVDAS